jgi:hypothetical protein
MLWQPQYGGSTVRGGGDLVAIMKGRKRGHQPANIDAPLKVQPYYFPIECKIPLLAPLLALLNPLWCQKMLLNWPVISVVAPPLVLGL